MEFESEKGHIIVRTILEVLGKPKKHVETTVETVVGQLKEREGTWILEEELSEAKEIEGLWSAFAELEVHFRSFGELSQFCFDFMPSSIEIVEPENMGLHVTQLNTLLNDLLANLHNLDMGFKNLKVQANVLQNNNNGLLKNLVLVALHYDSRNLEDLAGVCGLQGLQLAPHLTRYMDQGIIGQDKDGKYHIIKKEK